MDIQKIPFSYLLKQELPALATKLINIIESHDPEELKIKEIFDLLVAQNRSIKLLTQPYGSHSITEKLIPVRKNCIMYARSIVYNMNVVVKGNKSNQSDAILETKGVITRYLYRLDICKTESLFIKRINDFFTALSDDPAMVTAIEDFNLSKDVNNLRIVSRNMSELLTQRSKSISGRPLDKTKDLKVPLRKSIIDVIKQIEVAALKNIGLDYEPLIKEVNKTINEQVIDVNKRLMYNKRKAEGLEEQESNNESTTPVETAARMNVLDVESPTTENGLENGFVEKLDQKKTAATSVKQVQLPSKNNEA